MNLVRATDPAFPALWSRLYSEDALQYPLLTPLDITYSKEYAKDSKFEDVSFLTEENGVALMGVCLAVREYPDGRKEISGFGRHIGYLETSTMEAPSRDGSAGMVREELQKLLLANETATAVYIEHRPTLSPVSRCLLDAGGKATARFSQIINLLVPETQLRSQLRKSYKSLLNWGAKNLALRILDHSNVTAEAMEQFRQLHIEVAGRETRSKASWDLQLEMIRQREAFMLLGDLEGQLVTAALFIHSPKYCFYGVSASKRELFEKPLGHIVLWTAILQAKKIGCQFFETGEQLFPQQGATLPTPKELNISGFKKGFAGETYTRLEIIWKKPTPILS
jgi:hypothetical protein